MSTVTCEPPISEALLRRFDVPGPRYTSYPTADRFSEAFGPEAYAGALRQRAAGSADDSRTPLSLYVHIPFCASLCWYCACNKIITRHHERGSEYLDVLATEVALHTAQLGAGAAVSQLHLGGGSPTFLSDDELERLLGMLRGRFDIVPGAELSLEVDPRTADAARLARWQAMGFNRLSFGVQDLDPAVQQAVHRVQGADRIERLMHEARQAGFESINMDLIFGLPRQTRASFARTIEQVIALAPDRLAVYAYAHLPERFKPQRRIDAALLPPATERLQMQADAIAALLAAGYVYIGMDHFARPADALAVAQRQGRLHRNFQGYTVQADGDLIGLGVSAIGRVGNTYSQNAKTLDEYRALLNEGRLPVVRGIVLTDDDLLRRAVIMALMCQGRVVYAALQHAHRVDLRRCLAREIERLQELAEAGLVELSEDAIQVTPRGWFVVRAIAMVFDRHLQAGRVQERFSRII